MEPGGIVKAFPKRKKMRDDSGKTVPPKVLKEKETGSVEVEWLKPVTAYVLPAGIGPARAEIFHKQIVQKGGRLCNQLSSEVTHIIVAEDMDCDRAFRLLRLARLPAGIQLVKASWLSLCLREQKLLDTAGYSIFIPDRYLEEGDLPKGPQQLLGSEAVQPHTGTEAAELKAESQTAAIMPQDPAASAQQHAEDLHAQVREAAQSLNPGLVCVACGSYRRGKATCGDVDILVTHPDGQSHRGVFGGLLDSLRQSGFLTDDLVSQEDSGAQKKYLGVCRLPGPGRRHRRLDIIVVPHGEFACALLYFTGSAHFNRSMRALAKTKGMSLSEHALHTAVVRAPGSRKVWPGLILPTPTERDVFTLLGLPYREPAERDW